MELVIWKSDLEALIDRMDASPAIIREAKRKAFEASGPRLVKALENAFLEVGLHKQTGKVLSWQELRMGDKGGYAAISPNSKAYVAGNHARAIYSGKGKNRKKIYVNRNDKRYSAQRVTGSIEFGHKFPTPSGKEGYKPRTKIAAMNVPEYPFYEEAQEMLPTIARETAEQVLQALISHLEGD